jgi:hypothetical protein
VKAMLESKGHQVELRGGYLPKGIWGKLRIWFGLLSFPFNFRSTRKFKHFLKKEKPDLIWFNSLLRNLGGGVVSVAGNFVNNPSAFGTSPDREENCIKQSVR